ncbi:MAG: aminotransferase class V-fold PLP-dependent enzyme [Phycisphaerales bacterium]|nr:aminotransferase class V-fold PLP-dependent enzyme [Phycisphaerales bacterium]
MCTNAKTTTAYLDNAATSFPKAPGVGRAIKEFIETSAANPGRGAHRLAVASEQHVVHTRRLLTKLIHAEDQDRVISATNTTDALNIAISGVIAAANARGETPHVVTTVLEHNSVLRPLVLARNEGKITFTKVGCSSEGIVDPDDIAGAFEAGTKLVAVTVASSILGGVQPIAEIGRLVREKSDALFLADAAPGIGLVDIDVQRDHIDLLAFPGHKALLGPTGSGGLYVGPRAYQVDDEMPNMLATRVGGSGADSASPGMPRGLPTYFEPGTPNTVGLVGLGAGVEYVMERTPAAILAHERRLTAKLIAGLSEIRGITLFGPPVEQRVGIVSVALAGQEPGDVAAILDERFNIAVRAGLQCAPHLHDRLGTSPNGTVRFSVGPFNTDADIERACEAMRQIAAA